MGLLKENVIKELLSNKRNIIKLIIDLLTMETGIFFGILIKFEDEWSKNISINYFLIYSVVFVSLYLWKKNAMKSWSYTNSLDILNMLLINLTSFLVVLVYCILFGKNYYTVLFISFVFIIALQLLWRFLFRLNKSYKIMKVKDEARPNTLIYGAGEAGVALLRDAQINPNYPYFIKCIIDDDRRKIGTYINDFKVVSDSSDFEKVIEDMDIEIVIIAIPTIRKEKIREIIEKIRKNKKIKIKILPSSISEILQDENITQQIRDISIEDLLGREEIQINSQNLKEILENKVVFVTGSAGSIGSELVRQIAKYSPKQLIGIDFNENDLYFLKLELKKLYKDMDFKCEICNIREKDKVEYLFQKYKPEILFHAAAHKHVPLMEYNPEEAIKNNIFGTYSLGELAIKYGVDRFVLISTDKAVNPTNIMGATKRGCEIIIEELNKKSSTKFMAVRFGNVLGSNGSVIPIFKKLLSEGRNLTVTHKDIIRYFMTIPEATQLVIEAGAIGKGGELFVLDMGEPVKIMDLAKTMIKLSNVNVGIDIVGLRPGEKLYEELLYDVTKATKTENNKIFITKIDEANVDIDYHIEALKEVIKYPEIEKIKKVMKEFVITYKETNEL